MFTYEKKILYPTSFSSDEQARIFYNNNGYISYKNAIPNILLQDVLSDISKVFLNYFNANNISDIDSIIIHLDNTNKKLLHDLHVKCSKALSIKSMNNLFANFVKNLGDKDKPIFEIDSGFLLGLPKDKRLVYDFHQESNYMTGYSNIFNFHYPLSRISCLENGTMSILPKSHKLGVIDYKKKRISENSYTDLIPINIENICDSYDELHCYLEPSDLLIFHKDLIHRSNFNASNLCRPVGISRLTQ